MLSEVVNIAKPQVAFFSQPKWITPCLVKKQQEIMEKRIVCNLVLDTYLFSCTHTIGMALWPHLLFMPPLFLPRFNE